MKRYTKYVTIFAIIVSILVPRTFVQADLAAQQALEQELAQIQVQINELEAQLSATVGEKKTLSNRIKQLKNEQAALRLKIKQTSLQIEDLQEKMTDTKAAIETNEQKSARLKDELTILLRILYQKNRQPIIVAVARGDGVSAILRETKKYEQLSTQIESLVEKTRAINDALNTEQEIYEAQHEDADRLLKIATVQQSALNGKLAEQSQLLSETQGKESTYQQLLADNKKRAAEIRSRMYELLGVGTQINFGQAVSIATWVEEQTNVPAAFLLAILTQESNLGKNVGTCNRPGDPPEKSWKVVMKPTRDQEPFLAITKELGRDPDITPVSCPMRNKDGSQMGWGGAMGPAQFIPSTWVGYKDRVSALTGKKPADPWDIRDAFVAAALLLKNNGADQTRDGQWKAAMRYFSGGTNTRFRFYGDNVLKLTEKYKQDIKDLDS